jgi:peptidoglycan/LPS O-acetylase OafA/YrhL
LNVRPQLHSAGVVAVTERRLDIQALRGFAVLLVVFYHAGAGFLPAGYLGVDVFFVISGFLITSLVARAIERGDFSFREFYYRRAKRLLPAAYCVILATVLAAPFFISDVAFEELKAQVWGAITFTANFVLWGQSGYFDGAAETKPLLHFWSLAIEEQYYLVMPLLLILVPRRAWLPLLTTIAVASFAASAWLAQSDPTAAFYLPPTRAWELALGSLIAIAPVSSIPARIRSLARLPAILVFFFVPLFPSGLPHPSLDALLITLATGIIIAGASGGRAERSLPVRGLAFVGGFSYSLYLVHWPVIVFTRAAWLEQAPDWSLYLAVAISLVISFLLYRLVERPFHLGLATARARTAAGLVAASAILAASPVMATVITASNIDFNHLRRQNLGIDRACGFGEKYPFTGEVPAICRTKENPKVITWGDSYARAWTTALLEPFEELGVEQATMARCDPLLGTSRLPKKPDEKWGRAFSEGCIRFGQDVLRYIAKNEHLDVVVLAARFQTVLSSTNVLLVDDGSAIKEHEPSMRLVADRLIETVRAIRAAGKRVVVLAPPPANGMDIGECWERKMRGKVTFGEMSTCDLPVESVERERADTFAMLGLVAKEANVSVVQVYDYFCNIAVCRTVIDGILLYRDSGHLSVEGAQLIGEKSTLAQQILATAR